MLPIEFMKRTWDFYGEMTVRLVCFPVPPTPVRNLICMPDSFTSRTFEMSFDRDKRFRAVAIKPSPLGPAVLAYIKLSSLVNFDEKTGFLKVPVSTCCASVSYLIMFTDDAGMSYAEDVQLDRLNMIHRSCHPGSHYAVPKAPYLTALLQYAQAPDTGDHRLWRRGDSPDQRQVTIEYATPEQAEQFFQQCDFSPNGIIDRYLGTCVIDQSTTYYRIKGGLGEWARSYLRQMRHNLLLKEHEREQKI